MRFNKIFWVGTSRVGSVVWWQTNSFLSPALAGIDALSAVENKIPNVSDFDAEIKDNKDKYLVKSDNDKFTNNILDAKITAKKLVNETGFD